MRGKKSLEVTMEREKVEAKKIKVEQSAGGNDPR